METQRVGFGDYEDDAEVGCEQCGWKGPGFKCRQRAWRDGIELQCPQCATALTLVGFPNVDRELSEQLRTGRMSDGRPGPQVPKGMCPWCGPSRLEPDEDGWRCLDCGRQHPTQAYKCREATCWEFVYGRPYCERHLARQ